MARIFVSYRREDDSGHAGRLYDRLVARFGENQVFMDVDSLDPGVDFVDQIETTVETVDVFIAVIGPEWVTCKDAAGARRLDDPHDFVRIELGAALARSIRVVPVLVRGARMPRSDELPDNLRALARRNALNMTDTEWHATLNRLVESLDDALTTGAPVAPRTPDGSSAPVRDDPGQAGPDGRRTSLGLVLFSSVGLLALLGAGFIALRAATVGNDTTADVMTTLVARDGVTEHVTVTAQPETDDTPVTTEEAGLSLSDARGLQDASTGEMRRRNWVRALALAQRALPVLQSRDRTYEGYANFNIGNSLANLGRCDEAMPYLDRRELLLGPHPAVAQARRLCR